MYGTPLLMLTTDYQYSRTYRVLSHSLSKWRSKETIQKFLKMDFEYLNIGFNF